MSQARVHRAAKARKEWTCGKCGTVVKVGEPVLSFSVGYRGREQRRCDKRECYPTRSERESSMVAPVYDAIDGADWTTANTVEDLQEILEDIAGTMREVASEYENSEMFDKNEDLQERAEMLNSAADDLEGWEPEDDEPDADNSEAYEPVPFDEAWAVWFQDQSESAQSRANEAETP